MDMVAYFLGRLFLELKPYLEWALQNWAITVVALVALIYWAGRQRRINRHHL